LRVSIITLIKPSVLITKVEILKVKLRQSRGELGFDGSAKWPVERRLGLVPVLKQVSSM